MNNQIILIGRLTKDVELNETEEKKICSITLAVPRNFKNEQGLYETDFIPVMLTGSIAESTAEYCKRGDLIGMRGRIQGTNENLQIIADKVSFLAMRKEND